LKCNYFVGALFNFYIKSDFRSEDESFDFAGLFSSFPKESKSQRADFESLFSFESFFFSSSFGYSTYSSSSSSSSVSVSSTFALKSVIHFLKFV